MILFLSLLIFADIVGVCFLPISGWIKLLFGFILIINMMSVLILAPRGGVLIRYSSQVFNLVINGFLVYYGWVHSGLILVIAAIACGVIGFFLLIDTLCHDIWCWKHGGK